MVLRLIRNSTTPNGVFGTLQNDNGIICITLEHAFGNDSDGFYALIPDNIYVCRRKMSPKFGYDVFELIDTPGHDNVEIHKGNYNEDSAGCILLGTTKVGTMIQESGVAFKKFMNLMDGIDEFQLIVAG